MSEVWRARPVQSFPFRFVAFAAPVVAAIVAGIAAARILAEPSGLSGTVLWWAIVIGASMTALLLVERLARRLLPLADCSDSPWPFPTERRLATRWRCDRALPDC